MRINIYAHLIIIEILDEIYKRAQTWSSVDLEYARGVVSYFYFSRAPPRTRALKIRQINSAILKVPDAALSW